MNKIITILFLVTTLFCNSQNRERPNFIIILTDDQGYGDLSCFGGKNVNTPNIDKMADEGMKLTSFYVPAPLCTPSRAGLMTGCYPKRINMAVGSSFPVLLAADPKGLNPNEITIAEVLKSVGYKTGMYGKWHLGDQKEFLPTKQGFDTYFGIPYSHDIHPYHPRDKGYPALPLMDGDNVIEEDPNADYLVQRITNKAIHFIENNKENPFFMYMPLPLPHVPIHASPKFLKNADKEILSRLKKENGTVDYKTRNKLYKYAISEIDWSVGEVLKTLKKLNLAQNTFVIFTSDNGPAIGSPGKLRGKKTTVWEGGMREPTVMYWPGKIKAGTINNELLTTMDLLPTFAKLAGAALPKDRVIDGKDITASLFKKEKSPHKFFFYYRRDLLKAVRSGKWKLHIDKNKPKLLYDLDNDIGETTNVLSENIQIAEKLYTEISLFKKEILKNSRPAAFVKNPVPLKMSK